MGLDPTILRQAQTFAFLVSPWRASRRTRLLPRERFSPWAGSGHMEVDSGRTEVRAIGVIPLRTRSTLHRPTHAFVGARTNRREGRNSILRRSPRKGGLGPSSANRFVVGPKSRRSCEGRRGPRRHAASSPSGAVQFGRPFHIDALTTFSPLPSLPLYAREGERCPHAAQTNCTSVAVPSETRVQ